ncbi:hypothetical protein DFP72DRAFT_871131 [Ephemerocybe angulata]|uniref:DUF6533 domain-containing protein n=1 Tax=Ephemerocybe angulata TaxID=980116 RepID=A0A8H6IEQ5_9AGAR|nr:hypothetical protein DFP72DRAFT_871131 [Tulosesus angulatus]
MDEEIDSMEGISLTASQLAAAASMGFLYYDYFLTLSREVEWVWFTPQKHSNDPERITVSVVTLLINGRLCAGLRIYREVMNFVVQVLVCFFLIARTYALWNRNKMILLLMLAVSSPVIIYTMTIYAITHEELRNPSLKNLLHHSCLLKYSESRSIKILVAWIGVLVFDTLVFALSLYKVVEYAKMERPRILELLARDGTMYFGLVSLSCFATVITYWPHILVKDPYSRGAAEIIANSLASTLASRLFLNLRNPAVLTNARYDITSQTGFPEDTRFEFFPNRFYPGAWSRGNHNGAVTMSVQLQTLNYRSGDSGDSSGT